MMEKENTFIGKDYLTEQQLEDVPCRFDVVGIEGTKITLIKNAFGG